MTGLIETIQSLDTQTFQQDEEYEFSSAFLEWFYKMVYRQAGFNLFPVLNSVSSDPEYKMMENLCAMMINIKSAKFLSNQTRNCIYNDMKEWLIQSINKYSKPQN
jgi:hypothetical protein